jgi:hypothetical protein
VLLVVHKSPASSRPVRLKSIAGRQAVGDDSHIKFDDISRMTDDQLANTVRLRDARPRTASDGNGVSRESLTGVLPEWASKLPGFRMRQDRSI